MFFNISPFQLHLFQGSTAVEIINAEFSMWFTHCFLKWIDWNKKCLFLLPCLFSKTYSLSSKVRERPLLQEQFSETACLSNGFSAFMKTIYFHWTLQDKHRSQEECTMTFIITFKKQIFCSKKGLGFLSVFRDTKYFSSFNIPFKDIFSLKLQSVFSYAWKEKPGTVIFS